LLANRYLIGGQIGQGANSTVYSARHVVTGHNVAVKVMNPSPTLDVVEAARLFYAEAELTSRLVHPNTVKVHDFGQSDAGEIFLVCELIEGNSVARRLRRMTRQGRVMSLQMATMVGVGVLRSLGEAHSRGLAHRDIKPENIILHRAGPDDLVIKVLDFGIAAISNLRETNPGSQQGTPAYMSPEQALAKPVDGRTDIYSLGITLYYCLTGTLPFDHPDAIRLASMHVTEDAPMLGTRNDALSGHPVEAVIMRAIAKDRGARWPDAVAMRKALLEATDTTDLFLVDDSFQSTVVPRARPMQHRDDEEDLPDGLDATLSGAFEPVDSGDSGLDETGEMHLFDAPTARAASIRNREPAAVSSEPPPVPVSATKNAPKFARTARVVVDTPAEISAEGLKSGGVSFDESDVTLDALAIDLPGLNVPKFNASGASDVPDGSAKGVGRQQFAKTNLQFGSRLPTTVDPADETARPGETIDSDE